MKRATAAVSDRILNGSFPLPKSMESVVDRRDKAESLAGLRELVDDAYVGLAAREGIRCVEETGADPRLMLLIVEKAQEGFFAPTSAQLDHNRAVASSGGRAKALARLDDAAGQP